MAAKKNARRGECLGNKHHDGRAYIGDKCFAANENDTPLADEKRKTMTNWYDNVPAPVDSNGREVPLDTRELVLDGERREVYCFIYNIGRGCWSVGFKCSCGAALNACTLPDSWERLENDVKKDACEYFGYGDGSIYNKCQSCPAYGDDCGPAMAQDVVRRAKALAGVTDDE